MKKISDRINPKKNQAGGQANNNKMPNEIKFESNK